MAPKQKPLSSMQKVAQQMANEPRPTSANNNKGIGFLPPGSKPNGNGRDTFERQFDRHFYVPSRIAKAPTQLVEAVNDFHFAMMNDLPRNEMYYEMLQRHVTPETGVLEIGAGSGLLSMMAAKLGAKWVVAVEGSAEMCRLAQQNVQANNLQDKIKVLHMLSTDLSLKQLPERPHILVSEIFGTLLLGESALDYIEDVRARILRPDTKILPQFGKQYATLIECPTLDKICWVSSWNGLDLSHVSSLQDTATTVFTKKFGFRMSSVPYKVLSEPITVLDIDFRNTKQGFSALEKTIEPVIIADGTAHAMLYYWVASDEGLDGKKLEMSTAPWDTLDNFPRDMQWGQALQLLDATPVDEMTKQHAKGEVTLPKKLEVKAGEPLKLLCCTSDDHVILQFNVISQGEKKESEPTPAAAPVDTEAPQE